MGITLLFYVSILTYMSTTQTQLAGSSERFMTRYKKIKCYVQVLLTVSNVRIKVTHKLEGIYKGRLRYSSRHFQALRKIMKTLSQPRLKPLPSYVGLLLLLVHILCLLLVGFCYGCVCTHNHNKSPPAVDILELYTPG